MLYFEPASRGPQKVPRIFSLDEESISCGLKGLWVQWENGNQSQVLDINLAGILVAPTHMLSRVKIGDTLKFKLIQSEDRGGLELKGSLIKVGAQFLSILFPTTQVEGRLLFENEQKDLLIRSNLEPSKVPAKSGADAPQAWWHGPFDTNICIWTDKGVLDRFVFEYDHLQIRFSGGEFKLMKSQSLIKPTQSYFTPIKETNLGSVSAGNGYLNRALKIFEEFSEQDLLLREIYLRLSHYRGS